MRAAAKYQSASVHSLCIDFLSSLSSGILVAVQKKKKNVFRSLHPLGISSSLLCAQTSRAKRLLRFPKAAFFGCVWQQHGELSEPAPPPPFFCVESAWWPHGLECFVFPMRRSSLKSAAADCFTYATPTDSARSPGAVSSRYLSQGSLCFHRSLSVEEDYATTVVRKRLAYLTRKLALKKIALKMFHLKE